MAYLSVIALTLSTTGLRARAQTQEVGGTIGVGARGSESQLARDEARLLTGLHVSAWWVNRLESGVRLAWLDLPDRVGATTYYYGCDLETEGRCRPTGSLRVLFERISARTFITGQVIYHFRQGRRWRPFTGVAFGAMRDSEVRRCENAGCEEQLPGLQSVLGHRTTWHTDPLSPLAGVSTAIGKRTVIRGTFQLHRPFGEELSLLETSVGIAYRF